MPGRILGHLRDLHRPPPPAPPGAAVITAGRLLATVDGGALARHASGACLWLDAPDEPDVAALLAAFLADPSHWWPELPGPFAAVAYDPATDHLLLARDHAGQRGLCYTQTNTGPAFATWPPMLVDSGLAAADLAPCAIWDALVTGQPVPPETVYLAVRWVRPGHVWHCRQQVLERPAHLAQPAGQASSAAVRQALLGALSELPGQADTAAVLLSGGLDSAALAALMAGSEPVRALTMTFEPVIWQMDLAGPLADALHLSHRPVRLGPGVVQTWARLVQTTGLPQPDLGSAVVAEGVFAAAEEGHRTVITGLGGDELFGGPPVLPQLRWWERWRVPGTDLSAADLRQHYGVVPPRWPLWSRQLGLLAELLEPRAHLATAELMLPRAPLPPDALATLPSAVAAAQLELATRIGGRLGPTLGAAAALVGAEAAAPYLAPRLLAMLPQLKQSRRATGQRPKPLLSAIARSIPADLAGGPKRLRRRPDPLWLFSDPLPEPLAEALSPPALAVTGLFDPVTVHHWLQLIRRQPFSRLNQLRGRMLATAAAVQLLAAR